MTRTYQTVLARIEGDLMAGRLGVGGRLPGERVLAERYGVSRASVREAVKVLEAMGLVRTGTGSGPEAGAVIISDPAAPIGAALRWHLASRHLPVADLVGARVLIESWAAGTAAGLTPPPDLAQPRELLRAMDGDDLTAEQFLELDARFHVSLAALAGNAVIEAVMAALREGIRAYVTAAVERLPDWPVMARRLRAEHAEVLDAVARGDGAMAAAALRAHITGFYRDAGVH